MKASVVVPAFNEEARLGATLEAIQAAATALTAAGWTYELIVCDNNSTDATAAIARRHGAIVVTEAVNQIARARNAGAARATGEWLIFVDADTHPSAALFADVIVAIGRGCLAGGSTITFDDPHHAVRLAGAAWNAISRLTGWAAGAFIFCEAAAFRQIGGFDMRLYASEEIDLFRRLKRLARAQRRCIQILRRHPVVTSGRKRHLYSSAEHATVMLKAILTGGRTLRTPKGAFTWYDGRR